MKHLLILLLTCTLLQSGSALATGNADPRSKIKSMLLAYTAKPKIVLFDHDRLSITLNETWHLISTTKKSNQTNNTKIFQSKSHPLSFLSIQKLPSYGATPQDVFNIWATSLRQKKILNSVYYQYHNLPMLTFEATHQTKANTHLHTLGTIVKMAPKSYDLITFNTNQTILPSVMRQQFLNHLHSIQRYQP